MNPARRPEQEAAGPELPLGRAGPESLEVLPLVASSEEKEQNSKKH